MDTRQLGEITAFGIVILRQVTSDALSCTISEAQKFVALVDMLPIKGNMTTEAQKFVALVDTLPINGNMTIFITALQELLID